MIYSLCYGVHYPHVPKVDAKQLSTDLTLTNKDGPWRALMMPCVTLRETW